MPTGQQGGGQGWVAAACTFAGLALLLAVLFADVIASMAWTWSSNTTYNHGFFILPIAAFLVWRRRDALAGIAPRLEPLALLPLFLAGVLWLLGRAADVWLVENVALVAMFVALFVFVFGRAVTRMLWFPLLFLFFMVPVGDAAVPVLQDVTAHFAFFFLRLIGIPVFLDGVLIHVPNGVFEVAEACAGLRFLIANLVVAALFAHLVYTKAWKVAAFMALAVVIPIVANGFRALGIVLIAYYTDNEYAVGVDHLVYGWGFFTLVMFLVLFVGTLFADRAVTEPSNEGWHHPPGGVGRRRAPAMRWGLVTLAAVAIAAGPAYAWTVMRAPATDGLLDEAPPPPRHASWQPAEPEAPAWRPLFPGADRVLLETYAGEESKVDLFVAYYAHQRQGAELIYYANRLHDGETWLRLQSGTLTLEAPDGLPGRVRFERISAGDEQRLVAYWYWVGNRFTISPIEAKLLQTVAKLAGRDQEAAVVAVAAGLGRAEGDATRTIARFLEGLEPLAPYLAALNGRG
jgi:exosortase A